MDQQLGGDAAVALSSCVRKRPTAALGVAWVTALPLMHCLRLAMVPLCLAISAGLGTRSTDRLALLILK